MAARIWSWPPWRKELLLELIYIQMSPLVHIIYYIKWNKIFHEEDMGNKGRFPINTRSIFSIPCNTRLTQYLIAICTHYHPTGPKIFLPDPKLKIPVRPWLPVMLGRRWRAQRNLEAQLGGTSVWRRRCLEGARLQTQQRNEISYLIVKHNMQTLNPVLFCFA